MYSPIVAMDVAAENATELPRLGKPSMKLNVHASHTGAKGDNKKGSQRFHYFFRPRQSKVTAKARTNRYESGNAIDGLLCAGTWSLESPRRD
jgi:hypothetical protein